jgi:glutathione synthase/RimK-type ligase-like ATP-grasp enzyme
VMNSPKSIQLMFDKAACHQHFVQQNILVAPAIYGIKNYEDFCTQIQARNWQSVFIKPCYSSSASGVIAFKTNGKKIKAITSAKMELERNEVKFYNSLKLSTYTKKKDIAVLINFLAKEDIIVEQWIPKANTAAGVFDLRMVVIGGKAQHTVMRQSQSPLTNLHLGNERGNLAALQEQLGAAKWKSIQIFAEQAAQTLPNTLYTGLDILVSNKHKKNYVIEANAFGDLLPNIFVNNKDTYQTAIHYAKQQYNT